VNESDDQPQEQRWGWGIDFGQGSSAPNDAGQGKPAEPPVPARRDGSAARVARAQQPVTVDHGTTETSPWTVLHAPVASTEPHTAVPDQSAPEADTEAWAAAPQEPVLDPVSYVEPETQASDGLDGAASWFDAPDTSMQDQAPETRQVEPATGSAGTDADEDVLWEVFATPGPGDHAPAQDAAPDAAATPVDVTDTVVTDAPSTGAEPGPFVDRVQEVLSAAAAESVHVPAAQDPAVAQDSYVFTPSAEAAAAHEDATADPGWTPAGIDLTYRYLHADEYYRIVEDILGLAMSGDTSLQAALRSFQLTRDADLDAAQRARYAELLEDRMARHGITIPNPVDRDPIIDIAYDELLGIGPLGPLWRDEDVTDIMVNGPYSVSVERHGRLVTTPVRFRDVRHLQDTARRLSTKIDDRGVSRTNPIVTVQLPGARVQIVWEPLAVSGASVVIRKHRRQLTLPELLSAGALDHDIARFLADAVRCRATILVSGATGAGKTTYLNILSGFIPDSERVLVIEDARELNLTNSQVEYLLTKEAASADDTVVIGYDKLLRAALRMRPDRIVVGEILDAKGARAMLEAAFTGHDGTMSTIHGNNAEDALVRIAGLQREATGMPEDLARRQVWGTFDLIVQVSRDPSGVRYVSSVSVVEPDTSPTTLFSAKVPHGTNRAEFTHVAGLPDTSSLARRMRETGIDPQTWRLP